MMAQGNAALAALQSLLDDGSIDAETIKASYDLWRDLNQLGEDMGLHDADSLIVGIYMLASRHPDFAAYEALRMTPAGGTIH